MSPWFEASLGSQLGPLETQIMRFLWERRSATVRELLDSGEITGAYTTLMTTLDRLYKKRLLNRAPEGRAFRYSPRQTREEFKGAMMRRVVNDILLGSSQSGDPMSYLVDAVTESDRSLLDDLERAIQNKRRHLRKKEGR